MYNYYFTFMGKQSLLKNKYVCIPADSSEAARDIMFENFKDYWGFQYNEEDFAGQPEQYNLTEL